METESISTPEGDGETGRAATRKFWERSGIRPPEPGRGPRKMRYQDRVRGITVPGDENYTKPDNEAFDETASADTGGDLGLSSQDWAEAAATMAEEAAQHQDDTDTAGGNRDGEPPTFRDAFEPEKTEPDISRRDQKYREQLRETEAEADRLRGLVESMQRAEIVRLASARLADPNDLFLAGASVADMVDDDRPNKAKIDGAIDALLEQHPHWQAPRAAYRGELHSGATATKPIDASPTKFADAFAPKAE